MPCHKSVDFFSKRCSELAHIESICHWNLAIHVHMGNMLEIEIEIFQLITLKQKCNVLHLIWIFIWLMGLPVLGSNKIYAWRNLYIHERSNFNQILYVRMIGYVYLSWQFLMKFAWMVFVIEKLRCTSEMLAEVLLRSFFAVEGITVWSSSVHNMKTTEGWITGTLFKVVSSVRIGRSHSWSAGFRFVLVLKYKVFWCILAGSMSILNVPWVVRELVPMAPEIFTANLFWWKHKAARYHV